MIEIKDSTRGDWIWVVIAALLSVGAAIIISFRNPTLWVYGIFGIIALLFAVAVFLRPQFGVYVLILAVYLNISRQFTDKGYPSVIIPLVGITFISIVAYFVILKRLPTRRPRTTRIEMMLFAYVTVVALSFFVANDQSRAFEKIIDLVKDITIIYCILFAIQKVEQWKRAIWIIIVVVASLCALGLFQLATKSYDTNYFGLAYAQTQEVVDGYVNSVEPRLSGPINAPNLWAQVVVAVIPLVVYRIIYEKQKVVKSLAVLMLCLLTVELLFTYSRGAYLAFLITVFVIFLERRVNVVYMILTLILIPLLVFEFAPQVIVDRAMSLTTLVSSPEHGIYEDSAFRGRASENLAGINMFTSHPFLGVGVGNYENNYQYYSRMIGLETRAEERQPHSLYIELLSETGILGTVTFLGMVFLLLAGMNRTRNELYKNSHNGETNSWIISLMLSIVAYMTTSTFLQGAYIRYFWILVALSIIGIQLLSEMVKNHRYSS